MYVCPVCAKELSHSVHLKNHIISEHEKQDLKAKKIKPELVLAQPIKENKPA